MFAKRMIIFGWDRRMGTLINSWHTLPREEDCCSKYLNYKVFLLCSVITLSVYLLLVKIDGSPSNFFSPFSQIIHMPFGETFCIQYNILLWSLHLWNAINFGHIFHAQPFIIYIEVQGETENLVCILQILKFYVSFLSSANQYSIVDDTYHLWLEGILQDFNDWY